MYQPSLKTDPDKHKSSIRFACLFHMFVILLCLLWSGCFGSSYIEGLPCENDNDCLDQKCINGYCGGKKPDGETMTDAGEVAPEQRKSEPAPEPEVTEPSECQPGQTRPCYTGPAATKNVGACKEGQQSCVNGRWSACSETLPGKEVCDGKDNDCNGQIDDNLTAPNCPKQDGICKGSTQQCGGINGWLPCDDTRYKQHDLVYEAQETKCDGKDNDCNGQVDDLSDLGKNCQDASRFGPCQDGVWSCDGKARTCKATVQPTTETCDSTDQDCDGKIDNIADLNKPCQDNTRKGECQNGVWTCANNTKVCQQTTQSSKELCDGKDNDCDGQIDNGFGLGTACTAGVGECQATGKKICNTAQDDTVCDAQPKPKQTEICDEKDNDCNGQIDEGITGCTITFAGTSSRAFKDGPLAQAEFDRIYDLEFVAPDKLYVLDYAPGRLRLINLSTSMVSTVAGGGTGSQVEGPLLQFKMTLPIGMGWDGKDKFYISDTEAWIRKIDLTKNNATIIAGTGTYGNTDGPAKQASFKFIADIVVVQDKLYLLDRDNQTLRMMDLTQQTVTTVAGQTGKPGFQDGKGTIAQFNNPQHLLYDGNDSIYITDRSNHRIRKYQISTQQVTTVVGTGKDGTTWGAALQSDVGAPTGITSGGSQIIYFTTTGTIHGVWKWDLKTNMVSLLAGGSFGSRNGTKPLFSFPSGLAWDGTYLYIGEGEGFKIRRFKP